MNVAAVLAPLGENYEYILEWDGVSQNFRIYSRKGAKEFTRFDSEKSYFIYYKQGSYNLGLAGEDFGELEVPLKQGWNSPVYPFDYSSGVQGSRFFNKEFDYMLQWDRSLQRFNVYSSKARFKDFDTIGPGEGYFIETAEGMIKYVRGGAG